MIKKISRLLEEKFNKDVIVTVMGQMVVLFVGFGLNKVLSTKLGVSGFAEYSILKRTATVIAFVMLAGLGIALPRYISIYRELNNKVKEARFIIASVILILIFSVFIITLIYIFKLPFSTILMGDNNYESYILPILLYAFSTTLVTFTSSYYRGIGDLTKFNFTQIFAQLITLICAVTLSQSLPFLLYTWGFLLGIIGLFFCLRILFHYFSIAEIRNFRVDLVPVVSELTRYSLPRIPGEFILFSYTLVPMVIINYKMGTEISAYFAVATSISVLMSPLFSFVGLVLLPLFSKTLVNKKFIEADQKIKTLSIIYLLIGSLGILFVELFTPFVINLLFSSDFLPSKLVVQIFIVSIVPNAFYLLLRNPLDGISAFPYNTLNLLISFLILNILILLSNSIVTIAISYVIGYIMLGGLTIYRWNKCRKELT